MKKIKLIFLILSMNYVVLYSQSIDTENCKKFYAGVNILAPISGAKKTDSYLSALLPVVSNMEYDVSVSFGYFFRQNQAAELRASFSKMDFATIPQIQAGYFYFFRGSSPNLTNKGLYGGVNIRFWDYYNRNTQIHNYSIMPVLSAGYRFNISDFYLDARVNQMLCVYSWSTLNHSNSAFGWLFSPLPKFVKVLPMVNFDFGYRF